MDATIRISKEMSNKTTICIYRKIHPVSLANFKSSWDPLCKTLAFTNNSAINMNLSIKCAFYESKE